MAGRDVSDPLGLAVMPQLIDARVKDDDWTGLADATERKKRQSRIHQRAWRQRQKALRDSQSTVSQGPVHRDQQSAQNQATTAVHSRSTIEDSLWRLINDSLGHHKGGPDVDIRSTQRTFVYWEQLKKEREASVLETLLSSGNISPSPYRVFNDGGWQREQRNGPIIAPVIPYWTLDPTGRWLMASKLTFPLSADHQLLVLVQWNVLRATLINMSILDLLHRIPVECSAALQMRDLPPAPDTTPPNLQPTLLQETVPHDPWIDIVPWPRLRENLIMKQGSFDEDEFCGDMAGRLFEGFDDIEKTGVLVWGEPWSEDGWEMTDGFVKKWGFLLEGCDRLIKATNRWRDARGDERVVL